LSPEIRAAHIAAMPLLIKERAKGLSLCIYAIRAKHRPELLRRTITICSTDFVSVNQMIKRARHPHADKKMK
jgi:hypothetical protein